VKPSIHEQAFFLAVVLGALLGMQSFCRPRWQGGQCREIDTKNDLKDEGTRVLLLSHDICFESFLGQ
jgi:hypothetical protein